MLFISRENLEHIKNALRDATDNLRTYGNLSIQIEPSDDAVEAVALMALGAMVTADTGRADSVHPADVQNVIMKNGILMPIYEPPKLD